MEYLPPETNFTEMLLKEFGLNVPPVIPAHQREWLYHYCKDRTEDVPRAMVVCDMIHDLNNSVARFPWADMSMEEIDAAIEYRKPKRKIKKLHTDGEIVFDARLKKFLLYVGNRILVRATTIDRLKTLATNKHNFVDFLYG